MVAAFDFSSAPWIRGAIAFDPNGPTEVPYTPYNKDWYERPLIDVIGEIARRLPTQIAVDDGAIRLSYAQFYRMVCRLSHAIDQARLQPGPVAIKLPDDALYLVAMLGCSAAGRSCLLLSQENPPDYNRRLIEAAGLSAILVNAAEARNGSTVGGPRLIPIEPILMTGGEFDREPAGPLGPDEPAFILSTSGSTGEPKMIARSQRAFQQHASGIVNAGHYNESDRLFILGAPSTGAAVSLRLSALLAGATLHIVDVPRAGMGSVLRVLRDRRITILRATPSLIKALSQLDDSRAYLSSLRLVWGGGEMLLRNDLEQMRALLPPGCLFGCSFNMTEASVARWIVPENDDHDPVRVGAGYLVPETEALVLDDEGRPCPVGEIGELIVRGESVALGEWIGGRVVAERFQCDPTYPTKRIYRTGDLVHICPDGVLVAHGRKDRMVKIRGQRVEPAIIEAAIRAVPGVADAAVVVKQVNDDIQLFGFVTSHPLARGGLVAAAHDALKAALPSYMRPSEIRLLDSLPVNAGGKVDLKSLLELINMDGSESTVAGTIIDSGLQNV